MAKYITWCYLLLLAAGARAQETQKFVAVMTPDKLATPPVFSSPAPPAGFVEFSVSQNTISYVFQVSNLAEHTIFGANGAHIYCGNEGENGSIAATLATTDDAEGTNRSFLVTLRGNFSDSDVIDVGCGTNVAELVESILAGGAHVIVHSSENPDGEIRGQIGRGAGGLLDNELVISDPPSSSFAFGVIQLSIDSTSQNIEYYVQITNFLLEEFFATNGVQLNCGNSLTNGPMLVSFFEGAGIDARLIVRTGKIEQGDIIAGQCASTIPDVWSLIETGDVHAVAYSLERPNGSLRANFVEVDQPDTPSPTLPPQLPSPSPTEILDVTDPPFLPFDPSPTAAQNPTPAPTNTATSPQPTPTPSPTELFTLPPVDVFTLPPTTAPTPTPTNASTPPPTNTPTPQPTLSPTDGTAAPEPTNSPVATTSSPTPTPTNLPTTSSPTPGPTDGSFDTFAPLPTEAPLQTPLPTEAIATTDPPTAAPTPIVDPTLPPVSFDTVAPLPTDAPLPTQLPTEVTSPTDPPTPEPTPAVSPSFDFTLPPISSTIIIPDLPSQDSPAPSPAGGDSPSATSAAPFDTFDPVTDATTTTMGAEATSPPTASPTLEAPSADTSGLSDNDENSSSLKVSTTLLLLGAIITSLVLI